MSILDWLLGRKKEPSVSASQPAAPDSLANVMAPQNTPPANAEVTTPEPSLDMASPTTSEPNNLVNPVVSSDEPESAEPEVLSTNSAMETEAPLPQPPVLDTPVESDTAQSDNSIPALDASKPTTGGFSAEPTPAAETAPIELPTQPEPIAPVEPEKPVEAPLPQNEAPEDQNITSMAQATAEPTDSANAATPPASENNQSAL